MRYSRQRELILNIVRNRKDHPTADEIFAKAKEAEPNISLGTVYRNLKELSETNSIDTLETVDKKIHYDGDTSEHSHFICLRCGKIFDLFDDNDNKLKLEQNGFEILNKKCVYYGYCNDCKK